MPRKPMVREARTALNEFKAEIAGELGLSLENTTYGGDITSRQAGQRGGQLGGEMTKRLVENASKGMVYSSEELPSDMDE
ncbi:MAG: small, acid-soluble spore protein, alpha/beta type [Bacillota bacterium]